MTEPDALVCAACGARAFSGGVCGRCGYATGDENLCPHCGAVARAEPEGRALPATGGAPARRAWICAVCGGPRVPRGATGETAVAALREERTHLGIAARRTASAAGLGALAALSFVFAVLVAVLASSIVADAVVLAIAALLGLAAARTFGGARASRERANAADERAWLGAAEEIVRRSQRGVRVEELARALAIEPASADALLTKLAVHERARIDVGDDAEVRYSLGPEARVRVGAPEHSAFDPEERELVDAAEDASRHERTR